MKSDALYQALIIVLAASTREPGGFNKARSRAGADDKVRHVRMALPRQ
jgi:hypothetical protein